MAPAKTIQSAWQSDVLKTYDVIAVNKNPRRIRVNGLMLDVFPNVFSPEIFTDSAWFAKEVSKVVKPRTRFLEIGTGTGIVSLSVAKNGAQVVTTDINRDAIANARWNFKNYGLDIPVLESDIYDALSSNEKFDYIFWNHPFNEGSRKDIPVLLRAGFDYKYESLEKYISQAKFHLNPGGKIMLGTGSGANLNRVREIAFRHGYSLSLRAKKSMPLSSVSKSDNDYRVYELQSIKH